MLLKARYYIRLTNAFFKRFKGILLIGVFVGILIFLFINILIPRLGSNHLKIGITGRYRSENLPNEIINKISSGLTKINDNFEIEPAIAERWETADSGKTWTFYINQDIYWQDGTKLKSTDIKYNLSDLEAEYPDDETIILKLKSEFSPFLYVVSKPIFKKGLLGTGDWFADDIKILGGFVQSIKLQNKANETILYKTYPNEERLKLAFKLGSVDEIRGLYTINPFDEWRNVEIETNSNVDRVVTLFYNTQDPLFSDKAARQAMSYAIKKDTFEGLRSISPINPLSWAYNPQVKPYDYEPERAKELLDGIPDEIKQNGIKLTTTPSLLFVADQIKHDWEEVGIKTEILVSSLTPSEYQTFLAILEIPPDPDQYAIWHSTQVKSNISHYQNPRIDKLLEDGRTEIDIEKRRSIYLDFQRFLVEDVPTLFLYHPNTYTVKRK